MLCATGAGGATNRVRGAVSAVEAAAVELRLRTRFAGGNRLLDTKGCKSGRRQDAAKQPEGLAPAHRLREDLGHVID